MVHSKNKFFTFTALASLIFCTSSYANQPNMRIDGTIDSYVSYNQATRNLTTDSTTGQHIVFEKVILSSAAKKYLATHNTDSPTLAVSTDNLPAQVNLGMNNVPVLDQGRHGTCVTFATSAAIDAIHGDSDYVSQLCNLELGSTLHNKDKDYPSGWDGSYADIVLKQISDYGVISMASQRKNGCAGVYEYPLNDENDIGKQMPVGRFTNRSDKIMNFISYNTILNHELAYSSKVDMTAILSNVKRSLNDGNRVLIGTLLDVDVGHNGAVGTYKVKNDTWMMTPQIRADLKAGNIEAGHEMVITGYDDNAQVIGPHNQKQIGVLTLRNSWSSSAGDHGNYYMTYAHFKALAMEANAIAPEAKANH